MASPSYKWRPKFTPGSESCRILKYNEKRARLIAGGTFFRSKDVGAHWNSVNLTLIAVAANSGMFNNPNPTAHSRWNPLWTGTPTIVVELMVQHDFSNYLDYYYVEQGEVNIMPPPECTTNAIGELREQISGDTLSLIEMPTIDVQAPWNDSPNEDGVCLLSPFTGTLAGGDSGPAGGSGVRTGPEKAVININQSEKGSATGQLQTIQELREYNGSIWIPFSGN